MKIIILAAGRGIRLGALTEQQPKCLLELGNETILGRQLRLLEECGVKHENIIVVAGYKAESVTNVYENVLVNMDYYKTDNSYSLYLALKNINEDVIILDGDLVFEKTFFEHVLNNSNENVLFCQKLDMALGDTGVTFNADGRITAIGKHIAGSVYSYTGVAKISKNVVAAFVSKLLSYTSTWYTVPLNELLNDFLFVTDICQNYVAGINTYFDYISVKNCLGIENFCILVTGASGLLGKKVYHILKRNYKVIGLKHKSTESELVALDLNNYESVLAFFELNHPKVVINCAGIAEPDACERDQENAYKINVEIVDILRKACQKYNCKLIHISTDYVFDGKKETEYSIDDLRNPLNYYAFTKIQAENIVMQYSNSLIVRIPIIYGYNDSNDKETFPSKVLTALKNHKELYLDNKQIRYPVLIDEVATILKSTLSCTGIIHISSNQPVTKYIWAKVIAQKFGYDDSQIHEDLKSDLANRPPHTKLKLLDSIHQTSDIYRGTEILKKQMYCAFKLIYATHPGDYIYKKSVGEYRYQLGCQLGVSLPKYVIQELDCIVPVPSSGLYYAMGVAQATGVPFVQGLYKADTAARSFQIADNHVREKLIHSKIMPIRELIRNKTIALVDEAIFTGTTLKVVCDICKACKVKKIYICIPTPICYNRCNQYVRPERALLAEYVNYSELKDYFKVENIYFQPYDNFKFSLKDVPLICYDCFRQ